MLLAHTQSIAAMGKAIDSQAVTIEGLVQYYLDRIQQWDARLGSYTEVFTEQALVDARKLDKEMQQGRRRGPLHGVPVAIKDLIDIAGRSNTQGSHSDFSKVARSSALLVARLQAAGAVLLGKNELVEKAFGGFGTNAVRGTPHNPWDLECHRTPGGSSSGTAVAVAANLAVVGVGTDTGGSVRIPAALCGLVGLKTSRGKISLEGVSPLSPSLDSVGPLARNIADTALLNQCLSGEPMQWPPAAANTLVGARIGYLADLDLKGVDPQVLSAYQRTLKEVERMGAHLQTFSMGESMEAYAEKNGLITAHEGWLANLDFIQQHGEKMDPYVLARFMVGAGVSEQDYELMMSERSAQLPNMQNKFSALDAVLTPATPMAAIPVIEVDETQTPFNRFTRAVNYFDLCALVMPNGLTDQGLPIAVQWIASANRDQRLLSMAATYEAACDPFGQSPVML